LRPSVLGWVEMLRPPKPLYERAKLPIILLAYLVLAEWVDPFPFHVSTPARLAVLLLVFFLLREFHHARLEVDEAWAARTEGLWQRWRAQTGRVPKTTWLKVQRVAGWMIALYVFGIVVNTLTTRCDSAVQCAVLAPRMAVENLPTFIQFAVMVSLTLFQLGIMFYAMVKVGSYKVVMPGTIGVTFDDVWGQDDAKQKVMEQVRLLEDSDEVERAGGYMPKGLLLYGPPGTGKTYLAKAAANYSSKPLILVPPGAFQATFVGINLLKVWIMFRHVRKLARRYGGVIVFIDEIDSLGSRGGDVDRGLVRILCQVLGVGLPPREEPRDQSRTAGCVPFVYHAHPDEPAQIVIGSQMGTLEAFLSAMDGMEEPRGVLNRLLVFLGFKPLRPPEYKYLMMGATNMMSRLDPALLRAGRFGRKIHVTYPKVEGRLKTYEGYLARVTNDLTPEQVGWAARNHARGTGAEIKDMVNEALLITYRDGRDESGVVRFDDLMRAMLWVKYGESDGPFEREDGRWAVAIHEAGHAVAFHHLNRDRQRIWFATIEQHGGAGGMVAPTSLRDDWLMMRSELLADVQVSLASRVVEEMFFGETTNGHGGDGRAATERAQSMVAYGHAGQIGVYPTDSREVKRLTEQVLREALDACHTMLTGRKDEVEAVARLLMEKGTVSGDEIHDILDGMAA
jgi:cell division protease FtsH